MALSSFWNISKRDLDGTEDSIVWKKVDSRILNRKEILNVKLNSLTNLFCSPPIYTQNKYLSQSECKMIPSLSKK